MSHISAVAAIMVFGAVTVGPPLPAFAGQISFDDLPGTPAGAYSGSPIPGTYGGFTWSTPSTNQAWIVINQTSYSAMEGATTFPSPPNAAYNGNGVQEVDLFASAPTVFFDAKFLSYAVGPNGSANITVQGWIGGVEKWSVSETLNHTAFADLTFGSAAVTELKFLNDGNAESWWLVDNINYAVPEPASLGLFGGALIALAAVRRRRRPEA